MPFSIDRIYKILLSNQFQNLIMSQKETQPEDNVKKEIRHITRSDDVTANGIQMLCRQISFIVETGHFAPSCAVSFYSLISSNRIYDICQLPKPYNHCRVLLPMQTPVLCSHHSVRTGYVQLSLQQSVFCFLPAYHP